MLAEDVPPPEDLWERAGGGDSAAREELARLALEVATRELRIRGAPSDRLDDLASAAVAGVLAFLERGGEVTSNLRGFLKCRAWGVLSDERKRVRRARVDSMDDPEHLNLVPAPQAAHAPGEQAELADAVGECIERLAPPAAEAVRLRYEGGLANHEIAERTGASRNAINLRVFRAMKELRGCLESKGIGPEWAA